MVRQFFTRSFLILHAFFISNTFISNTRLKLAKNQVNGKQHSEAKLFLFEIYSHSSFTLSSEDNRTYSKKQKNKGCFHEIMRLINHNETKIKVSNRSHINDINRPRSRH